MGSIPITRSILLVRNESANARNTFLLQRLRGQMLVGFEGASKVPPSPAKPRKRMCERLSVVSSGRFSATSAREHGALGAPIGR
ncbi:MAG: hypothetical protein U1E73_09615 [Planctomycetota bacterium]